MVFYYQKYQAKLTFLSRNMWLW